MTFAVQPNNLGGQILYITVDLKNGINIFGKHEKIIQNYIFNLIFCY